MIHSYVSIDLEMTGLHPIQDKVIEIGAVKVIDGRVTDTFSSFVNPGIAVPERITQLTGITQNDLEKAPSIQEVLNLLLPFLGELPLVGHSILTDYSFLKKAAVDAGIPFERQGIDTLRLSRAFLLSLEKKTLSDVCAYYEIPLEAHRAWHDAEATAKLYERLGQDFYEKEPALFEPKPLLFKPKKQQPATIAQKEQLAKLLCLYQPDEILDLERISRSEASRWIGKLLQAYVR